MANVTVGLEICGCDQKNLKRKGLVSSSGVKQKILSDVQFSTWGNAHTVMLMYVQIFASSHK